MPSQNFDPFPKYLQIREIVLRGLRELKIGDKLPTEDELAAQFRVSRETIRGALRSLEHEGIISRRPRLGTWLSREPSRPLDARLTGPIEDFTALGISTTTRLLGTRTIRSPSDVAAALGLWGKEDVFELKRVRFFEGQPLCLLEAYLPLAISRRLARRKLDGGLIVPVLRELLGCEIREEHQKIEALAATRALASLLGMRPRDPVLRIGRLFVDSSGQPVAFFKVSYHADRYYYTVNLPRPRSAPNLRKTSARRRRSASSVVSRATA